MNRKRKLKQAGGYLSGPSHEQGGITAYTPGQDPIELEGGEYIINAQTVNALGTPFLDQLNSTATTHHQGGFGQGQLPSPSQYKNGGKINNRRSNMRRGGRPARRMQQGGHTHPANAHYHQFSTNSDGSVGPAGYMASTTQNFTGGTNQAQSNPDSIYQSTPYQSNHSLLIGNTGEAGVHNHPGRPRQQMTRRKGGGTNGRNNMRRGGRPTRKRRGGSARPAAQKMRRGGRPRRMAHGGSHNGNMMNNSCPPGQHMMPAVNGNPAYCMDDSAMRNVSSRNMSGRMYGHGGSHSRNNGCGAGMMMSNGGCVPMSGGYRRGGRTRSNRRMMHGGMHNALGAPMNPNMGAGYVFEATNQQYNGPMVRMGQVMYSAPDGVYSSNSKPLVHMSDNVGPTRRLGS